MSPVSPFPPGQQGLLGGLSGSIQDTGRSERQEVPSPSEPHGLGWHCLWLCKMPLNSDLPGGRNQNHPARPRSLVLGLLSPQPPSPGWPCPGALLGHPWAVERRSGPPRAAGSTRRPGLVSLLPTSGRVINPAPLCTAEAPPAASEAAVSAPCWPVSLLQDGERQLLPIKCPLEPPFHRYRTRAQHFRAAPLESSRAWIWNQDCVPS